MKEHEQKLKDYRANPDAHDHKGILKDRTPEERARIRREREEKLEGQIKGFGKDIEKDKTKLPNKG